MRSGFLFSEWSPEVAYNALPLLPPKADVETVPVLKATIRARAALADLRGAGRALPNQAMLIRALLLQEARLSSEIENIVTTNDALYQALSRDQWEEHPHVKEVLRYGDALRRGMDRLKEGRPLAATLFREIASVIKGTDLPFRDLPGTAIVNDVTKTVIYTPPVGRDRIVGLLDDLAEFYHSDIDLDPLIKMAIAHYQFEAIHPFSDGNGRTGRVLNLLFLVQADLLDVPVIYMSRKILQDKGAYYRGLLAVTRDGAWEEWILYLLNVVTETAIDTRHRMEEIVAAMERAAAIVRSQAPRVYSRELVETIFSQPYTRIGTLVERGLGHRDTAAAHLRKLEEIGLLESLVLGRDKLYANVELMRILAG